MFLIHRVHATSTVNSKYSESCFWNNPVNVIIFCRTKSILLTGFHCAIRIYWYTCMRVWEIVMQVICAQLSPLKSCTSSDQCGPDACCVANDRKKAGKRFIFHSSGGSCRPKRYQGQVCHVYLQTDFGNPNMYLNYCPCDVGLTCRGQTVESHTGGDIHHNPRCIPAGDASTNVITYWRHDCIIHNECCYWMMWLVWWCQLWNFYCTNTEYANLNSLVVLHDYYFMLFFAIFVYIFYANSSKVFNSILCVDVNMVCTTSSIQILYLVTLEAFAMQMVVPIFQVLSIQNGVLLNMILTFYTQTLIRSHKQIL